MGAWHRLEQIRFAIGYGVKGLEETRNLGSSKYKLRFGRALYSRETEPEGVIWVETGLRMVGGGARDAAGKRPGQVTGRGQG